MLDQPMKSARDARRTGSVTKGSDILALNWWINLRSKGAWATSIAVAAAIAADGTAKTLGVSGESVAKTVALFFVLFVALMAAIWPVGIIVMLLHSRKMMASEPPPWVRHENA
jgi:hypothetical protein